MHRVSFSRHNSILDSINIRWYYHDQLLIFIQLLFNQWMRNLLCSLILFNSGTSSSYQLMTTISLTCEYFQLILNFFLLCFILIFHHCILLSLMGDYHIICLFFLTRSSSSRALVVYEVFFIINSKEFLIIPASGSRHSRSMTAPCPIDCSIFLQ